QPKPTLFPYTTLFRSERNARGRFRRQDVLRHDHLAPAVSEGRRGVGLQRRASLAARQHVARGDRALDRRHRAGWSEVMAERDKVDRKSTRLNSSHVKI